MAEPIWEAYVDEGLWRVVVTARPDPSEGVLTVTRVADGTEIWSEGVYLSPEQPDQGDVGLWIVIATGAIDHYYAQQRSL